MTSISARIKSLLSHPRLRRVEWVLANIRYIFSQPQRRRVTQLTRENEALQVRLEQQADRFRKASVALEKRIESKFPRYQYGSFAPGIEGWRERWEQRPGKRILLYANKDYSGSFMGWARAINEFTDYAARLVVLKAHAFGYPLDLLFFPREILDSDFVKLRDEADCIHIKDETGFLEGRNSLPKDLFASTGKPLVFTQYGGFARKHQHDPAYRDLARSFDARITMTPDLNYPWFDGAFIPHAVDVRDYPFAWKDGNVVAHSPSTRARKGTTEFLEAMNQLRDRGLTLDLIEGVPHAECVARKARATLFFDQAGRENIDSLGIDTVIGWYGNSALEAAAYGIPTFAHLSDQAFEGAERAGRRIEEDCAILNTPPRTEGIRETIARFFDLEPKKRETLARRTRSWIEDFHSYPAVASELATVYGSLLASSEAGGDSCRKPAPTDLRTAPR